MLCYVMFYNILYILIWNIIHIYICVIYLDKPGSIILEAMPLLVRSSFAVRNACWSVSAINQNIYSHQAFSWIGGTKSSNQPFTKVHHMKTTPATTYPQGTLRSRHSLPSCLSLSAWLRRASKPLGRVSPGISNPLGLIWGDSHGLPIKMRLLWIHRLVL